MGYTVYLEAEELWCKSEEDAIKAAAIINSDDRLSPYHLRAGPSTAQTPDAEHGLIIEHFQGDHWHDIDARQVWLQIAPHMANGATIELQGEDGERWRIRWQDGRVFEDHVTEVIWAVGQEITAPVKENAP